MSRIETRIIPREYSATKIEKREYGAMVRDNFVEEPPTTIIEDFEGASITDFTTQDFAGDPQYAIIDRGGDDWLEIYGDDGDSGFVFFNSDSDPTVDIDGITVDSDVYLGVGTVGNISVLIRNNDIFRLASQQQPILAEMSIPSGEISGNEVTVSISINGDTTSAELTTPSNEYKIEYTGDLTPPSWSQVYLGAWGNGSSVEVFFNDLRS